MTFLIEYVPQFFLSKKLGTADTFGVR